MRRALIARPAVLAPLAAPARCVTYFARATPSTTREDLVHLMQTHAGRVPATGSKGMGHRLTPAENGVLGVAKRSGVLLLSALGGSQQLCNAYFKYCYAIQRPYIAVDRHGLTVSVDVAPVCGLAKSPRAVELGATNTATVLREISAVLAATQASHPGLQLTNDATLRAQAAALLPGPLEGSNKGRSPDTAPALAFTLFAPTRDAARAVARDMHARFVAAFGLPTPADVIAARAQSAEARRERGRALLLRRLAKLAAAPVAVKNLRVPAGAIAGFLAAQRVGDVVMPGRGARVLTPTPPTAGA